MAQWYEEHGYQVVARNWACRSGELDIVARKGSMYVFCEVKTRSSAIFGLPAQAVDARKQARLRRLAALWLAAARSTKEPAPGQCAPRASRLFELRFDVASVLGGVIEVIEEAF